VPMALVVLETFPSAELALEASGDRVRTWLEHSWDNVVLRRERQKPVGSPRKLAECLLSCAAWVQENGPRLPDAVSYDELWDMADEVKFFGRYSKMKFLECLRRLDQVSHILPDLRSKGGWSPREGLALLYPEQADLICYSGDGPDVIAQIEELARHANQELLLKHGVFLDTFEFQVLICDFKQVVVTKRQYPGRSLDSELTYWHKVANEDVIPIHVAEAFFAARHHLFPEWALGEIQGWDGVRKELGKLYAETGVMWTDCVYDYAATVSNGGVPVRREQ